MRGVMCELRVRVRVRVCVWCESEWESECVVRGGGVRVCAWINKKEKQREKNRISKK